MLKEMNEQNIQYFNYTVKAKWREGGMKGGMELNGKEKHKAGEVPGERSSRRYSCLSKDLKEVASSHVAS